MYHSFVTYHSSVSCWKDHFDLVLELRNCIMSWYVYQSNNQKVKVKNYHWYLSWLGGPALPSSNLDFAANFLLSRHSTLWLPKCNTTYSTSVNFQCNKYEGMRENALCRSVIPLWSPQQKTWTHFLEHKAQCLHRWMGSSVWLEPFINQNTSLEKTVFVFLLHDVPFHHWSVFRKEIDVQFSDIRMAKG